LKHKEITYESERLFESERKKKGGIFQGAVKEIQFVSANQIKPMPA